MRNCSLCDLPIEVKPGLRTCSYCGITEDGDHACANGHYTCQTCRTALPSELVARVCLNTAETDPYRLANLIMSHPVFNQMGPQFHIVAGPAALAALANGGFAADKQTLISSAIERLKDIPALSCSSRGICGAAAGAGVFASLLNNAGPLRAKERSLALKYSASALRVIAEQGGIRCCRQSVLASIETILQNIKADFGFTLRKFDPVCSHPQHNPECKKRDCPYYAENRTAD